MILRTVRDVSMLYYDAVYLSYGQDLLILSRLNDLTNCWRCFNVDILMLYISGRDHYRKLKFSSYVHLPSINKMFQYRYV